jgi:hypothetical protein
MMIKKWWLVLVCLLLGCSSPSNGRLDKLAAAKVIQSTFDNEAIAMKVEIGRVGSHCAFANNERRQTATGAIPEYIEEDLSPDHNARIIAAIKAGYVVAAPDGNEYWQVSLTDKGRAAVDSRLGSSERNELKGCDYQRSGFVVATPQLVRVTSISFTAAEFLSNESGRHIPEDSPFAKGFKGSALDIREDSPIVKFDSKWALTAIGAALRDSQLTPEQRNTLNLDYWVSLQSLSASPTQWVPPQTGASLKQTVQFSKAQDGSWRY